MTTIGDCKLGDRVELYVDVYHAISDVASNSTVGATIIGVMDDAKQSLLGFTPAARTFGAWPISQAQPGIDRGDVRMVNSWQEFHFGYFVSNSIRIKDVIGSGKSKPNKSYRPGPYQYIDIAEVMVGDVVAFGKTGSIYTAEVHGYEESEDASGAATIKILGTIYDDGSNETSVVLSRSKRVLLLKRV